MQELRDLEAAEEAAREATRVAASAEAARQRSEKIEQLKGEMESLLSTYDEQATALNATIKALLIKSNEYSAVAKYSITPPRLYRVNVPTLEKLKTGYDTGFTTTEEIHAQIHAAHRRGGRA